MSLVSAATRPGSLFPVALSSLRVNMRQTQQSMATLASASASSSSHSRTIVSPLYNRFRFSPSSLLNVSVTRRIPSFGPTIRTKKTRTRPRSRRSSRVQKALDKKYKKAVAENPQLAEPEYKEYISATQETQLIYLSVGVTAFLFLAILSIKAFPEVRTFLGLNNLHEDEVEAAIEAERASMIQELQEEHKQKR